MLFRLPVDQQPGDYPNEADAAGYQKSGLPSPEHYDEGHDDRSGDRTDIAPGVEDAGGQGAFLGGEPFRYGLDGGREVAAFGQAQSGARDFETQHAAHGGVQ